MKKLLFLILVVLAGTGAYFLAKRANVSDHQINNNTAQDCPPFCVPDKKSCG